jgi:hypothetical protein
VMKKKMNEKEEKKVITFMRLKGRKMEDEA